MLFQLKDLNTTEQESMINAPIWAGILVGCADGKLNKKEVEMIEQVIKTKTFSEQNDVHYLYQELCKDNLHERIAGLIDGMVGSVNDKARQASEKLEALNSILPKLEEIYARQFLDSLHDVAVSVANVSGGVLGIGAINFDEKAVITLPMINKI